MSTYFPTVPVEVARQKAVFNLAAKPKPLVLVVDDEPIIAETLEAILNGSGLAVMTAPNGLVALEIARLIPPEMLITDISMPGMNGLDLAHEVKRIIPDCEIVLFSGQASMGEHADWVRAAGREFVTLIKPVHPADLLERVFDILGRRGSSIPHSSAVRSRRPFDPFAAAGSQFTDHASALHVTVRHRSHTDGSTFD